jgi:apolipoprotein N-acyltransferase
VVLRRAQSPRRWMGEVIVPMLVMLVVIAQGYQATLRASAPAGRTVRLALIQPSIPQRWIWSEEDAARRFQQLLALTTEAIAQKPDVIVWPEAAVPGWGRWDTNTHAAVTSLARSNRVWLILGADDAEPRGPSREDYDVFNASFLVSPQGEFGRRYAKRQLVIFGEYLPFVRWLPFLAEWTGMGSFTPGDRPVPFAIPELRCKTSVLICFEDVFPHLAREYVESDTDFLLNLTNNGWFGESAAQWQHAAAAVFRAVENGRPLVRCANNGLTCWVDAAGRMRDVFSVRPGNGEENVYGSGFQMVEVPLLDGQPGRSTFYTRYGDVFGWLCVAASAVTLGRLRRKRGKEERGPHGEHM